MPSSWAPSAGASMAALAWPMHHRVCSGVSVRMEHSQPVVPWRAKNREIFPKVLGGGSVHVHPVSPVSVQVQKAWHQHPAAQVFDPQAGGVQLADSGDPAVLHQQIRLLKTAVHIDAAAGKEQFFSHGVPLQKGWPAAMALV